MLLDALEFLEETPWTGSLRGSVIWIRHRWFGGTTRDSLRLSAFEDWLGSWTSFESVSEVLQISPSNNLRCSAPKKERSQCQMSSRKRPG